MDRYYLFLSHSHQDSAWTRRLVKSLRRHGIDVWLGHERFRPGANWSVELTRGLKHSAHVVTIVDPKHTSRPNLYFEAGAAIGMGKKVTFVVPKTGYRLPSDLQGAHVLKRLTPEATARQIVRSLKIAKVSG